MIIIFAVARKPPVAPIPLYPSLDRLPDAGKAAGLPHPSPYGNVSDQNQSAPSDSNCAATKKLRPFDVENLIKKSEPSKSHHANHIHNETLLQNSQPRRIGREKEDKVESKKTTLVPCLMGNAFAGVEQSKPRSTPSNECHQENPSPQLPAPSPTYPIQTKLSADAPNVTTERPVSAVSSKTDLQIPNISHVPTINNNYINAPPATSHSETASFWDLYLPHSMPDTPQSAADTSAKECSNDITIKDILTDNLNLSKTKVSDSEDNLNKVNTPRKEDTTKTNVTNREPSKKKPLSSSVVVLNVPLVNFPQPPVKRMRLSKIDVAIRKRRLCRQRRLAANPGMDKESKNRSERMVLEKITTHRGTATNFGVHVYGYSDSSSSSSYSSSEDESDSCESDLRPTPRPDVNKMEFLRIFEITTFKESNGKFTQFINFQSV